MMNSPSCSSALPSQEEQNTPVHRMKACGNVADGWKSVTEGVKV